MLAIALLTGPSGLGGCSFVFVQPARKDGDIVIASDCTSNPAAPVVDTILVATNLMSSVYVANQDHVSNKGEAVTVGVIATAFWLSSAVYGYYFTGECKNLREAPPDRPRRIRRTVLSGPPVPIPPPTAEPPTVPAPTNVVPAGPPAVRQKNDTDAPTDDPAP